MDLFETVIIAIVEGLTEFLPVSSTGHMIIAQSLLGVESTPFVKAFTVIIQFGAILSVICLYWKRFFYPNAESKGKSYWRSMFDFYARLVVGVLPAVVLGLAFNDFMDKFENWYVVSATLILYGIAFLFIEKKGRKATTTTIRGLSYKTALLIGAFQVLSIIPGTSRSGSTILGATGAPAFSTDFSTVFSAVFLAVRRAVVRRAGLPAASACAAC